MGQPAHADQQQQDVDDRLVSRPGAAFSIVELLVVIMVIAVLLAIILPALAGARARGISLTCETHLAELGKAHALYALDHDDALPTFSYEKDALGVADPIHVPEWGEGGGGWVILPISEIHFWAYQVRHYVVPDADAQIVAAVEALSCPVMYRQWRLRVTGALEGAIKDPMEAPQQSYLKSPALFTSAGSWRHWGKAPDVNAVHDVVSMSQVAHPSSKTLLVEQSSFHARTPTRLIDESVEHSSGDRFRTLGVDGHVAARRVADALRPHGFVGFGAGHEIHPVTPEQFAESGIPLLSTHLGAAGRDW